VFHDNGQPIGDFRKAWKNALDYAGLPAGLVVHDLRRSGVRNAIRGGTPEHIVMAQSGHKTRAMLQRYDIVSEDDLAAAAERTDQYVAAQREAKVISLDIRRKTA
jgi:integrase